MYDPTIKTCKMHGNMTLKFIFTAVSHGAITLQLANIRSVKFTALTGVTVNM